MKHQQSGFTLIELVVVMVIAGTLAATAVPKFASLTTTAEIAAAESIQGAFVSEAVILFGQTQSASSFATISGNVSLTGGGSMGGTCSSMTATSGSTTVAGIAVASELCSG